MPTGRDHGHRLPAVLGVLLGTLLVLAGCAWAAAAPGGGYGGTGAVAASGYAGTAVAADAGSGSGSVPGCGRGLPDADDGARPGMPPRGSTAHEPVPATQQLPACLAGALPAWDDVRQARAVLRAPPPLGPPSPVALSVLRV